MEESEVSANDVWKSINLDRGFLAFTWLIAFCDFIDSQNLGAEFNEFAKERFDWEDSDYSPR